MRPCVEKMQGLFVCKKSWLHITKTLCLCGFPLIKVNYPIRNLWDNYRKKHWKKKVKIGVKSTNMAGGYLRKIRGIGYEWSSKVEKVLYSRLFFNASSGAENVLKTYFVFGTLTKGFHNGKVIKKVDTFYASSQTCHCCGYKNEETKDLKVREWICPKCYSKHDRDVNASINILMQGILAN